MRKGVDISIIQTPIWINFTCSHCENEIEIDYDEFGHSLSELFHDHVYFECPECNGELSIDEVILD